MAIRIGCGQITWRANDDAVLADIRTAGYEGAPWSREQGDTAEAVAATFARFELQPAPTYYSGRFWDRDDHDNLVRGASELAATSAELGVTEIFVADAGFDAAAPSGRLRREIVTHVREEDALPAAQFAQMASTLDAVGSAMLEHGVRPIFHNHGGTFVETENEIERLLDATDPQLLLLGPDTGHLAWAGVDPVAFVQRHAARIAGMHLKDVHLAVRDQGRTQGWGYADFEREGIWAELGEGDVGFPAILDELKRAGFNGWLIVETDVPERPTPLESAMVGREYLRSLGY